MKRLIELYKRERRYREFSHRYKHFYAFVGMGSHATANLHPVLDYLGVPLKYVVTAGRKSSEKLNNPPGKYKAVYDPEAVFSDETIQGIFICTDSRKHYTLCKSALEHKKSVFIEKPPCAGLRELDELICLQKETGKEVVVGLQRRYAPACRILKKRLRTPQHYSYKYCTGAYPEGNDILTELFIHPVDQVVSIFGPARVVSQLHTDTTILLQLLHSNGVIGSLELSTGYSWQLAEERLIVVEKDGIYELINLTELVYRKKPPVIGGIPLEKVFVQHPVTEVLFNQNMFQPIMQHNNLYVNGFYTEVETFISICEEPGKRKNDSGLAGLRPTYELLEEIRERKENND